MKGSTIQIIAELVIWHLIVIGLPIMNYLTNKPRFGLSFDSAVLIGSFYCIMIFYIFSQWLGLRKEELKNENIV
jgi:hypothetical protein